MFYVDSSVLVALYLGEPRAKRAQAWLASGIARISSWLLAVEVVVALRRSLRESGDDARLKQALERFDLDVQAIALFDGLPEIAGRIRTDARLSGCRSADAIHVATALELRERTAHAITVLTFDARLADTARAVGLVVGT